MLISSRVCTCADALRMVAMSCAVASVVEISRVWMFPVAIFDMMSWTEYGLSTMSFGGH